MSPDQNSDSLNQKVVMRKLIQFFKDLLEIIINFKGGIIVIITWLVVAELSGYSLTSILWSILKLILYPLNLLLFNTEFSAIDVPQIYILLVPLVVLTTIGFLVIISTED